MGARNCCWKTKDCRFEIYWVGPQPRSAPISNENTQIHAGLATPTGWVERSFPSAPNTVEVNPLTLGSGHRASLPMRRFEVLQPYGSGFREFAIPADNLHLMLADFAYESSVVGKADGHDFLKFHFKLSGHNLVRFGARQNFLLQSGTSVIAYHPRGLIKDDCHTAHARECSLTLSCAPQTVLDLMQVQAEDLPAPLSRYFTANSPDFFCHSLPLTAEMVNTIQAIIKPRYDGHLRRLHMEARSLDLICLMLDTLLETNKQQIPAHKLRASDVEALHAVRAFLDIHYAAPPSIPALARRFGLNRTKLTEGFRLIFGETVFNYVQRVRMLKAKELLLHTDLPISIVAEKVGYERQTSFATAFRQHCGFSPRSMKKLQRHSAIPSGPVTSTRPDPQSPDE